MDQGKAEESPLLDRSSRAKIGIRGIIQGVGFRPFIYRLARQYNIDGSVRNTASGVLIEAEGLDRDLDRFLEQLPKQAPPAARISSLHQEERKTIQQKSFNSFVIRTSEQTGVRTVQVAPDMDICQDCLTELFAPNDRRYLYPFINCTNCGPRYTIIRDLPYDRPSTSMSLFRFCPKCKTEYLDPENRRFHAQPNCCPACGPKIQLLNVQGEKVEGDPLTMARYLLNQGKILAIKGIGGFHLAVDAANQEGVMRLRQRKNRPHKPLAVMAATIYKLQKYATVEEYEEELLLSIQKPIVLLNKIAPWPLAEAVAPNQNLIGAMLPYSPLHHLLFFNANYSCLVMTSGNLADEPIIIDNDQALARLGSIADYFLIHDREILTSNDDSVVRSLNGQPLVMRRSRSYAPAPLELNFDAGQTLAVGASQKNAVCFTKGQEFYLSQHIGDLTHLASVNHFESVINHLGRLLDIKPSLVVHDLHPDYASSRYAKASGLSVIGVQHHHAHAVSCMVENGLVSPVLAITMDGAGLGDDGTIWGGEILIAEYSKYSRVAHLTTFPLPGGDLAAKNPWRSAISCLYKVFGNDIHALELDLLTSHQHELETIISMIDGKINSPITSSCGRLFDCVAALTGIRQQCSYEGQAAMELEMAIEDRGQANYPFEIIGGSCLEMNWMPMLQALVEDLVRGTTPGVISAIFHNTLTAMLTQTCIRLREETGLGEVVLSGGVFQNATLLTGLCTALGNNGFTVYNHKMVPPNDGGLALGQAVAGRSSML